MFEERERALAEITIGWSVSGTGNGLLSWLLILVKMLKRETGGENCCPLRR